MKITLSRDEIKGLVKDKLGISTDDFILEILNDGSKTSRQVVEPQPAKEPDVEYDITVDKNGFITDMVPKTQNSTVPFKDKYGRTYNYENKCKICGKTFFTMVAPASVCSEDCLKESRKQDKKENKKPYTKHVYDHKCVICGKNFKSGGPRSKYCSEQCRHAGTSEYVPSIPGVTERTVMKQKEGSFKCAVPKEPRIDYMHYAEKIEEFLNSNENVKVIDNEDISAAGMRDRYKIAANMFDLADKIHLLYSSKRKTLRMTRAEVMKSAAESTM